MSDDGRMSDVEFYREVVRRTLSRQVERWRHHAQCYRDASKQARTKEIRKYMETDARAREDCANKLAATLEFWDSVYMVNETLQP